MKFRDYKVRAIMVAVEYSDLLQLTLPYNRHHFEDVMVVTSKAEYNSVSKLPCTYGCNIYATDSFYSDGAVFNKWKALEEGLDVYGRYGWLCVMDADVLWPQQLPEFDMEVGKLYTPLRRMHEDYIGGPFPTEKEWWNYYIHRNIAEWAGYSQIFHSDDPVLGGPPWHEVNWRHAGGADSMFQLRWDIINKIRPPFEVLHLGPAGVNWCGRSSTYTDGTVHEKSAERLSALRSFVGGRKGQGDSRFKHEKF